MRISRWASDVAAHPALQSLLSSLDAVALWPTLALESRPFFVSAAHHARPCKSLIVVANYDRALQWQAKLQLCGVPESQIRQLPSGTSTLYDDSPPEAVALSDRIGALRFLIEPGPGFVIGTPQAVLERTLPIEVLESTFLTLRKGDTIEIEQLLRALLAMGYEAAEPVRVPGQYSQRGGILDVFAIGADLPIRMEFFGDDIDGIRSFDPGTQRSLAAVKQLTLIPTRETLYHFSDSELPEDVLAARESLAEMIDRTLRIEAASLSTDYQRELEERVSGDVQAIRLGTFFDRLDLYRPLLHPDSGCAADLLPKDGLLILDEPTELEIIAEKSREELAQALSARQARGEILEAVTGDFLVDIDHLGYPERRVALLGIGDPPAWFGHGERVEVHAASLEAYRGRPEALAQTMKTWQDAGFITVMATDQPTRAKSVLSQIELFPQEEVVDLEKPGLYLAQGNLAGGFSCPEMKLAVITDHELFGVGRLKLPQRKFNEGAPIATVLDLKPGDYVVHINYGIGVFQGLVRRTIGEVEKECLYIQYGGPDKLFVPADQLDRVQKYLTPGDTEPKINRLHNGEWQRAVGKAREEAREFARDLIRLYAHRKRAERPTLGPDSPWQAEMEATFPWMETPSQMEAIKEVKRDLQTTYPMDRLVCGDVGFGKTEVAIRAAFKVAQAGKQVVVLCPTTILSEQHYRTFAERLGAFPTRLDFLNRFRTAAERREIVAQVEAGEVDILIGTHALLSSDLHFKDLGLVIIDEEHKFGVKQKEMLKKLRSSVDVLSMSATPIPRTLSMALMDIRQMSLINDPPPGRLPIRTFVRNYSQEVVREAILRELARGGQVYYVYNRVTGIYHTAEKLKKLVPMARIGVGHGQMSEKELEPVMLAFIKGELDILLSTTIIENGLDISNANTMIIENADRLGLSQLYQLRGRVGRSDRQAYAYLLYQNEAGLTENALARLQSLQEFSSLGSGYSLAFRDLQIRGAGELLGAKQSGTMATVGYELFAQIIGEEIQFLKSHADGDDSPTYNDPLQGLLPLPTVDLPVEALIPEHYVPEQAQRLYYYKTMMSARDEASLRSTEAEIVDRYGSPPSAILSAFRVMRCRIRASEIGMKKIDGHGGRLVVDFDDSIEFNPRLWSLLNSAHKGCFLARGQMVWTFVGDPIAACEKMQETFVAKREEIERHRAALGLT